MPKITDVVCGALIRNGKVLIARRVSKVSGGWYEFPGGKVEPGESREEALKREWREEMGIEIEDVKWLADGEDLQPDGRIRLSCYTCISTQDPRMHVHDDLVWTEPDHIYDWKFFESDRHLVKALSRKFQKDLQDEDPADSPENCKIKCGLGKDGISRG